MIDLERERIMTLRCLAEKLPGVKGTGSGRYPGTLRKWIEHGVDGVRLDAVKIAGTWYSSIEAFNRWVQAQNNHQKSASTSPARRLQSARRRLKRHRISPSESTTTQT